MNQDEKKQFERLEAAITAYPKTGWRSGVGTGSTVRFLHRMPLPNMPPVCDAVAFRAPNALYRKTPGGKESKCHGPRPQSGDLDLYVDGADEATRNICT